MSFMILSMGSFVLWFWVEFNQGQLLAENQKVAEGWGVKCVVFVTQSPSCWNTVYQHSSPEGHRSCQVALSYC